MPTFVSGLCLPPSCLKPCISSPLAPRYASTALANACMGEDTVKLAIWTNLRPQFFLELGQGGQGGGKGGGNLLLQRLAPLCMTELAEHEVIKKEFFELEKGVDGDEAKVRSKRLVSTIKRWIVDSDVDTSTQAIRCVKELSEDPDNAKKLLKRGFLPELVKAGSRTELNTKVRVGDNKLNTNVSKADAGKANVSKADAGAGGKLGSTDKGGVKAGEDMEGQAPADGVGDEGGDSQNPGEDKGDEQVPIDDGMQSGNELAKAAIHNISGKMVDLINSLTAAPDATSTNWEDTVDWNESDNMSQEARRSMACRVLSSLSMVIDPAFLNERNMRKEPGQSISSSNFGKRMVVESKHPHMVSDRSISNSDERVAASFWMRSVCFMGADSLKVYFDGAELTGGAKLEIFEGGPPEDTNLRPKANFSYEGRAGWPGKDNAIRIQGDRFVAQFQASNDEMAIPLWGFKMVIVPVYFVPSSPEDTSADIFRSRDKMFNNLIADWGDVSQKLQEFLELCRSMPQDRDNIETVSHLSNFLRNLCRGAVAEDTDLVSIDGGGVDAKLCEARKAFLKRATLGLPAKDPKTGEQPEGRAGVGLLRLCAEYFLHLAPKNEALLEGGRAQFVGKAAGRKSEHLRQSPNYVHKRKDSMTYVLRVGWKLYW